MGMSASQARLLSLTSRMHDLEYQAQGLQYSKLDLVNLKDNAYNEYNDVLDSTKFQMSVITPTGNQYQDVTYNNMMMSNAGAVHSMYMLANASTGQILLPEQVAKQFKGGLPESLDDFMTTVAKNYLYSGRADLDAEAKQNAENVLANSGITYSLNDTLSDFLLKVAKNKYKGDASLKTDTDYMSKLQQDGSYNDWVDKFNKINTPYTSEMKGDGNYDYWQGLYYQMVGYTDDGGNIVSGRGFCPISQQNSTDRDWLSDALNSGEVQLFKMTKEESIFTDLKADTHKINIFAETSMATDPEITEVQNTELIAQAESKYEKTLEDIDAKDTKLDLQLSKIDTEHNALKTEYDSVKQIVSKSIDRSFKTFNA